jgi:hypothetical protein
VSVFPRSTLLDHVSFVTRTRVESRARCLAWYTKYKNRGFQVLDCHKSASKSNWHGDIWYGDRRVGDVRCWTIRFQGDFFKFLHYQFKEWNSFLVSLRSLSSRQWYRRNVTRLSIRSRFKISHFRTFLLLCQN